jgi:hypothetical protein
MISATEYRQRAADAEALAQQMSRRDHRDEALKLAEEWRRMAEAVERRDRSFDPRR